MKANLEDLISVTQAAELRGRTRQTILDLIERGKLTPIEIAGRTHLSKTEVMNYDPNIDKGGRPPKPKEPAPAKKRARQAKAK